MYESYIENLSLAFDSLLNGKTPEKRPARTKIVATIGPASRSPEMLSKLIKAGANVFRLNFSHGSPDEHLETLKTIRKVSDEIGTPVAVLQDLSGPKIRITNIEGDFALIEDKAEVELSFVDTKTPADKRPLSGKARIFVEAVNPSAVLKVGERVLLADGAIELKTLSVSASAAKCVAIKGGRIRSRVGIAFPDSQVDLPATTDKDMRDFAWGLENNVDFVAVSFVQNAKELQALSSIIKEKKASAHLIAKIERRAALLNIDEIMDACDGIMVARGDLGLELPLEQVPVAQKLLIEKAHQKGKPVIVATQMLLSMVTSIRPTRAEVTDVAFAVVSGADAVMLSEETTIGEHPAECVECLVRIAAEVQRAVPQDKKERGEMLSYHEHEKALGISDAIAIAACAAALKVKASAIIACTESGNSARLVSKYRPSQPIYGVSSVEETLRKMALLWGVTPIRSESASDLGSEIETDIEAVKKQAALPKGSTIVITQGKFAKTPGSTNGLSIREL